MRAKQKSKDRQHGQPGARQMLAGAVQLLQAGRLAEARSAYQRVLADEPRNLLALHHLGVVEHQLGRPDEAIRLLRQSIELKPDHAHAFSDLAVILMQLDRDEEAVENCRKAIALDPKLVTAHSNLGDLMQRAGYAEAAEKAYAQALALQPRFAAAHSNRADALVALGRLEEAHEACNKAIALDPQLALPFGVKGLIMHRLGQLQDAVAAYEEALRRDPRLALVHTRLGNVYRDQGRLEDSLAANERALQIDPGSAAVWCNQALTLQRLGRWQEALGAFQEALRLKPVFPEALAALGLLLHNLGQFDEAANTLRRAVQQAPHEGYAYVNLGSVLKDQGQLSEAAETFRSMLSACGDQAPPEGLYDFCNLRRNICDWAGLAEAEQTVIAALRAGGQRMPPFAALAMSCTPEDHLALARRWASGFPFVVTPRRPDAGVAEAVSGKRPLRLGYLSGDFFQHATASLIAELIERHDRSRFQVNAYCYSPEDGSPMRQRLKSGFDEFRLITSMSHTEAAALIADDGVDILIDLKGYTRNARPMIAAQRSAPIQVNYLGYPSTMGADFIDYIIADATVAPMAHQPWFDEKIVQLPGCYQPNDCQRLVAGPVLSRADCGLPEHGFVFCSFNNAYKITAPFFDIWMRLLQQVPESVLWLLDANALAKENLRHEAAARGIDPERLIFAPKLHSNKHLARYPLADLFLDNLPVNAHTTASEALWSGLPVVTCLGEVFVGRVAASLLTGCGVPELITHTLPDYEALALRLAQNPSELAAFQARLANARHHAALFDTAAYAKDLEAAFTHMARLHADGQAPVAFAVADLP